jgi:hypothetical protein
MPTVGAVFGDVGSKLVQIKETQVAIADQAEDSLIERAGVRHTSQLLMAVTLHGQGVQNLLVCRSVLR